MITSLVIIRWKQRSSMLRGPFRMMMMSNVIAGAMIEWWFTFILIRTWPMWQHSSLTPGCSWEQHSNNFASAPEMKLNTRNKKTREINSMKVQRRTSHSPTFDTHPKPRFTWPKLPDFPEQCKVFPDTGSETSISTPHRHLFDTCLSMVDHESSDDVCFERSLRPSAVWSMALIVGSRKVEANKLEASSNILCNILCNLGSVLRDRHSAWEVRGRWWQRTAEVWYAGY